VKKTALFISCAVGALGLGGGRAHSAAATATATAADAAAANPGATVGELVVTAQKREQSLQTVPVAISAYTSEKRDQIGIDSVQDMSNFTPGLVYNTGNDRVSLRGIGRYTNQLGADSSVGVYEDGAFETFTVKAGNDSIFVDRVEVLRGPQGTLYGRASIGGAINIISRKPTKTWYAEVRASLDNYLQHIEEGAISGPLTDNIQFRVAASKTDQEIGYFKNLSGGPSQGNVRNEWYLEGQLQGQFGPKFDWWLKAFGGEWHNLGGNAGGRITSQEIVGPDGVTPVANPSFALLDGNGAGGQVTDVLVPALGAYAAPGVTGLVTTNPSGLNPQNFNVHEIYSTIPQIVHLHAYYGGVLKLNYHLNGFDIRYIGAAQHYSYRTNEEWGEGGGTADNQLATGVISYVDPNGIRIFPNSQLLYGEEHFFTTNEINIISTGSSPLQWVIGAYNFNETYQQPEEISLVGQTQLATPIYFTGAPAPLNRNRDVYYAEGKMGAETFAGFAQADWQATKAFKFTGGVRYSYDAKYGLDLARLFAFGPQIGVPVPVAFDITSVSIPLNGVAQQGATAATINPATGIAQRKLGASWGGVTATAGVQWQPNRDTNVYAKYSRGYKSGGFNTGFGLAANPETKPEDSNDYQFGIKLNVARSVQFNLDLFYDQYYNAQIPVSVQNGTLLSAEFYNIPEARSYGVELETTWSPSKALQFILDYGYNGTEILNSGCIVDAQGDPTATRVGATPDGCPPPATPGGSQGQNLRGAQLPNAPENKIAVNGNYTFFFQPGSLSLSASYVWRDAQYGSIFNRPYNRAPSWDQVDLRAEWKSANGHYSIIAYGKNVFDTVGYQAGRIGTYQASGVFLVGDTLIPPATYGLEFQYRF
jgi:iron complex outermembrane receptor protein